MRIDEINPNNKFTLFRNLAKKNNLTTTKNKNLLKDQPGIDPAGLSDKFKKTNSKNKLKSSDNLQSKKGNFSYEDVADSSKFDSVNEFYNKFNADVTGNDFKSMFYVAYPGSDQEGIVAGKAVTKTNNRVVELILGARKPKSLNDATFTTIRIHVGKKGSVDRQKIEAALGSDPNLTLRGFDFLDVVFPKSNYNQAMSIFWKIFSIIESENISSPGTRVGSGARSMIVKKNTPLRYYMGAATILYAAYRFRLPNLVARGGKGDDSSAGIYDIRDDLITIGITSAAAEAMKKGENTYREHAVPGDQISKAGLEMYEKLLSGKPMSENDFKAVIEVAQMIKNNLSIVRIAFGEEKILNSQGNTNPMGWTPENNDILARFKHFKIPVYSIEDGKRIA